MPASLFKKRPRCRFFWNFQEHLLTELLLATASVARENTNSGLTTILGRSMSLKNKLLGDVKQNMKIISENGKNYNSFNLKEKEFKNETKSQ